MIRISQDNSIIPEKSCQGSLTIPSVSRFYFLLVHEPIEIDHYINFLSDKSKHMAFEHPDWLETN